MDVLKSLGWNGFFKDQVDEAELGMVKPARIIEMHRNHMTALSEDGVIHFTLSGKLAVKHMKTKCTVGDWVLAMGEDNIFVRMLDRRNLFDRRVPGRSEAAQLIAANIDTLFIVTSCNHEFNLSRLERYVALAFQKNARPVVVLTKIDLIEDADFFKEKAASIHPDLAVIEVNSLDPDSVDQLHAWCIEGETVALLGSSGVGKSTIVNTLHGHHIQKTAPIREDDAKGRHTTTSRSLHILKSGGVLLDSPGMRELQLVECEEGVDVLFEDIRELERKCKFKNCGHNDEPGCAVSAAIESGDLEERRFLNYRKMQEEQIRKHETVFERRKREKRFSKMVTRYKKDKHEQAREFMNRQKKRLS